MKCQNCGADLMLGTSVCPGCGKPAMVSGVHSAAAPAGTQNHVSEDSRSDKTPFILGIIAIVMSLFTAMILPGLIAFVLAVINLVILKAAERKNTKLMIAKVLSIFAIVITVVLAGGMIVDEISSTARYNQQMDAIREHNYRMEERGWQDKLYDDTTDLLQYIFQ